jgi:hypothetical protein
MYRGYLMAIASAPLALLRLSVRPIQLAHAVMGALVMPLLALSLLVMNNREGWVGWRFRNGAWFNALLVLTLVLFRGSGRFR